MTYRQPLRFISALALTVAVFLAAYYAPKIIRIPLGSFIPSSFVTHSFMAGLSIAAMWLISKGKLSAFGFRMGTYKFSPRILLWVLPTAALATLQAMTLPHGQTPHGFIQLSKIQTVIFIWIYSSVCEETLVRGLLQTLLGKPAQAGAAIGRKLSLPVVVSGVFFGAMHLVLIRLIGSAAIPIAVMATFLGLIAAHYRERTGSLLPALFVHALFNIGGSLPLWIIMWIRG